MAYYNSYNHYEAEVDENLQTPYGNSYDFIPSQSSPYEYNDNNLFEYDPTPFYSAYDSATNHSITSYSISTISEPLYIEYDPSPYGGSYNTTLTQFTISYSVSEFNEPEFEEYDPTPYGGGYDPSQTYGKPLPPSDEICYPRSKLDQNAISLNGFSYGSIPSPYGKEKPEEYAAAKPKNESKPTKANEEEQQPHTGHGGSQERTLDLYQGEDAPANHSDDHNTLSGYGSGYEYEKKVPEIPYGYGLEAMDLCESLFGYWPCFARNNKSGNGCQGVDNEENNSNPWKGTADYLFGSAYPYRERRQDGGNPGDSFNGYERYYQVQPHYGQVEYDENSW